MAKVLSGQVSLTPGVAVAGANIANITKGIYIVFPSSNTSTYVWIGNNNYESSSDVVTTGMFKLKEDQMLFLEQGRIENMNELWLLGATDATTDGSDVVCWITG